MIITCFGLSGLCRGEFGSWTGGLVVGFLGGLSLGLDIIRLTIFTILCGLVFSQGWGKYIEAIQTGKNSFYGYMGLTWLGITYCLCGLILPNSPTDIVRLSSQHIFKLGWGLLAMPLALVVDSVAKVHLKNWDSWKIAEFAMTGWLGFVFMNASYTRTPIPQFGLIVWLFALMGLYKFISTEIMNINTAMMFVILPFYINLWLNGIL